MKTTTSVTISKHQNRESIFYCKNRGDIRGRKPCFSLPMNGFGSSTAFDTEDYYFRLNLSQVLLTKVLLIKNAYNVVFQSSKNEEKILPNELFLCLSGISLGQYCRKSLAKSGGFRKNIQKGVGGWPYRKEGRVYRRGRSNHLHTMLFFSYKCTLLFCWEVKSCCDRCKLEHRSLFNYIYISLFQ